MFKTAVRWWNNRQNRSRLKKEFLAERDLIFFREFCDDLDDELGVAMERLESKYRKLGLTQTDIDRLKSRLYPIRVE